MSEEEARAAARHDVERGDFVSGLAEKLGASAGASAVFGEAVEREGVTVIPVARATWGFGGGVGEKDGDEGYGGGGGTVAAPHGYIEIKDGGARYRRVRDPLRFVALLAAGAALVGAAVLFRRGR